MATNKQVVVVANVGAEAVNEAVVVVNYSNNRVEGENTMVEEGKKLAVGAVVNRYNKVELKVWEMAVVEAVTLMVAAVEEAMK